MEAEKQFVSKVNEYNKSKEWITSEVVAISRLPWPNWYQNKVSIDKDVFDKLQSFVSVKTREYKVFFVFGKYALSSPIVVHGGLTYTLMDTYSGYVATLCTNAAPRTKKAVVEYKGAVYINKLYILQTKILGMDGKICTVQADIVDNNDKVCMKTTFYYRYSNKGKLFKGKWFESKL
eukprot:234392_1